MFDVIECFQSASPTKQTRLIVFQTANITDARSQADKLLADGAAARGTAAGGSTFVVVDRSTSKELYRVPTP